MATDDLFRARLDRTIELCRPQLVLATRPPWAAIEAALTPKLAQQARQATRVRADDLRGSHALEFGRGFSNTGRSRLPVVTLMNS